MEKIKTDGLKEVVNEVIGLEHNKILATIKYLTINPSQVVSEYCKGEKTKYLSPVVYYLGVESLKSYLFSVSGFSDYVLKIKVEEMRVKILSLTNLSDQLGNHTMNDFFIFFAGEIGKKIITLPLLLLLTWLFYKRQNNSFKENSWFALYSAGHASLLSLPLMLLLWYTLGYSSIITTSFITISLLYWAWASIGFYNIKFVKAIVLRTLMGGSIYFIVLVITFLIAYFG
jgi:hypothetical protein